MNFFDSHCHLQDDKIKQRSEQIIQQACTDGVAFMVCCSSCESDWEDVAVLARKWKQVIPAFGIHPWYVTTRTVTWLERLSSYLYEFPGAAVGEIGLDHHHAADTREEQLEVFTAQLELAAELKRPVSVHCLKAWGDLLSVFSSKKKLPERIALHSFSGSVEIIRSMEKMGCYFSCSGAVTHHKNTRIRNLVSAFSSERILLETDTPDIPLENHSGYTVPSLIQQVNAAVASLRGVDQEMMASLTFNNACNCFGVGNG
ncbi:MAG TPA: TatD family hydrolase [Chitinispirillaceae bacterium]|nr:TatD family hydrolase [Chitinispirillaceae bacterium]